MPLRNDSPLTVALYAVACFFTVIFGQPVFADEDELQLNKLTSHLS